MQEEVFVDVKKVEIKLVKSLPIIKETLSRIGIANREKKVLYPSCYVQEANEKIYIAHFKELLRVPKLTEIDLKRRNTILFLMKKWGLIEFADSIQEKEVLANIQSKKVFILSKEEKNNGWSVEDKWHYEKSTKIEKGEIKQHEV